MPSSLIYRRNEINKHHYYTKNLYLLPYFNAKMSTVTLHKKEMICRIKHILDYIGAEEQKEVNTQLSLSKLQLLMRQHLLKKTLLIYWHAGPKQWQPSLWISWGLTRSPFFFFLLFFLPVMNYQEGLKINFCKLCNAIIRLNYLSCLSNRLWQQMLRMLINVLIFRLAIVFLTLRQLPF